MQQFEQRFVRSGDLSICVYIAGEGEPLLLIHGYPETHLCWWDLAPKLVAEGYQVICPDLRGYGASDKPVGTADHANYSKRAMASDMIAIMDALGHERFRVVGHDRGARVTHRLCLDHPDRVLNATLIDIIPTRTFYEQVTHASAQAYFHWFFLTQPHPLPERLIGGDPLIYLHRGLGSRLGGVEAIEPEVLAAFEANMTDPAVIHATCEDYRAGATIDLEHDRADQHKKISCPLLVVWGTLGPMGQLFDVLATWQDKAIDVRGAGLECGHYPAQEKPDELLALLNDFL
ncbi:alpha/beta fold hydrolase [Aestuariirhabdus litorea]|uniref:Alpha/beta hydrolase n=1 Tax=Aestuariirhabdus litorea TaxID=2528527 RepID=A0A3P3VR28_9GAMM|nr:alpha/beta hydrolase [Aestuariirhabdus litorea]RRJ85080.1 alpha/beta hydrolase [Aestuariirhabdus litorea]RWW98305.1 alpha/beta fold hydrolase [Endozoicomonadaceae bacterium GTF-13]